MKGFFLGKLAPPWTWQRAQGAADFAAMFRNICRLAVFALALSAVRCQEEDSVESPDVFEAEVEAPTHIPSAQLVVNKARLCNAPAGIFFLLVQPRTCVQLINEDILVEGSNFTVKIVLYNAGDRRALETRARFRAWHARAGVRGPTRWRFLFLFLQRGDGHRAHGRAVVRGHEGLERLPVREDRGAGCRGELHAHVQARCWGAGLIFSGCAMLPDLGVLHFYLWARSPRASGARCLGIEHACTSAPLPAQPATQQLASNAAIVKYKARAGGAEQARAVAAGAPARAGPQEACRSRMAPLQVSFSVPLFGASVLSSWQNIKRSLLKLGGTVTLGLISTQENWTWFLGTVFTLTALLCVNQAILSTKSAIKSQRQKKALKELSG